MTSQKTEEELLGWFEKDLLPQLIARNKFPVPEAQPENLIQIGVDFEETGKGVDSFASTPYFLKLTLQDKSNPKRTAEFRLIVKFITQNLGCRAAMETDVQFFNEMVFYDEVLPAFRAYLKDRPGIATNFLDTIFPVCRYAHIDMDSPDYGIVIMDDLRVDNFTLAASKAELALEYCLLSVKKLAQMHAVSYSMKLENDPVLGSIRTKFRECRYQDNRYKEESTNIFLEANGLRAIEYLLTKKDSEVPESYLRMLEEKVRSGAYKLMGAMTTPREPISTICHGDFCRNNIMFRIEKNCPTDVRLFDFQTWRYSSPAIDLTFFMYMNTTLELREKHFDGILNEYYDTLTETVSAITSKSISSVQEILPRQLFVKDFAEHALFGYLISSFFLPMMMVPREDLDFENQWGEKTPQEMAEESSVHGGEIVTRRITEIIIDMYRRGCYL